MIDKLKIKGAREHNLKNISLELPKNSLVVLSGLSGSGKSSLAFDTIFAEGQRRYMESLSSYARQFLGRMEKPDVDSIEGLSPAIAIEQKSTNRNPRSTVGTVTEIYDYYRLLFARVGKKYCPKCGREISEMSIDQIISIIFSHKEDGRIMVLAPVARGKKGEFKKTLEDACRLGYVRAMIDKHIYSLDEDIPSLDKNVKHNISILIDRMKNNRDYRFRLSEAIEKASEVANGFVEVVYVDEDEKAEIYSEKNSCPDCGITFPEVEPRTFSFNNPFGACPECNGLGFKKNFDVDKLIPDMNLSFNEGAIKTCSAKSRQDRTKYGAFFEHYGYTLDTPISSLPDRIFDMLLYGSPDRIEYTYTSSTGRFQEHFTSFPGLIKDMERRLRESFSMNIRMWLESFQSMTTCPTCHGDRLKKEALSVRINGKNIMDISKLSVKESILFFKDLVLSESEMKIASQILREINSRLKFLENVGLGYLTLQRQAQTLSGGEAQRIRLATQIGSALTGVMYVLDEPSIGLHQRDNWQLIRTLENLRDLGNTVIVVEHDEDTLRSADYLVDIGPGAGELGGYVVAKGTPNEVMAVKESYTGQYLAGNIKIEVPETRRKGNGKFITLKGCRKNNLKNIDVSFPLGTMTTITGVSGSGKSTLLREVLLPSIKDPLHLKDLDSITGLEYIDKVIDIDQSPIGRTPRSNPATYVDLFTPIRELFASMNEAKARGYTPGRFSFNVPGGRCENCQGDGEMKIEMHFLPDVFVKCDVCGGKRYNKETLEVTFKGKNIADVLDLTVREALDLFSSIPKIKRKLETLMDVGLDYIKLGQSALTLSGGEAQRVKLALELSKVSTGNTLYVLDEPTTGLHFVDVKKLLEVLGRLVDQGNTVLLIEHNLDVIKSSDYIIDLGPEGGDEGGYIVAKGTPEEVASVKESYTGMFLKRYIV